MKIFLILAAALIGQGCGQSIFANIFNAVKNAFENSILSTPAWPEDYSCQLSDGAEFDYVVVGGGGGGIPVATRLALSGATVLLVEAGGNPNILMRIPGASMSLLTSPWDWQYKSESNNMSCLASMDRQCRVSAGLVLGGGDSIGHMTYIRGNRREFDNWNITGWTWKDLYTYFLKYEGFQDLDKLPTSSVPYHNTTGFYKMEYFTDPENPWQKRIKDGFESLNFPFNPDINAKSQIGVTKSIGYVYKGERMSLVRAYLTRKETKTKLNVALHTTATQILMDDQLEAKGVVLKVGLFSKSMKVYARKEIIISAGYIATPQLLLLSGIGPADELKKLGIKSRMDLSVGKELIDHLLPLIAIKVDKGFGIDFPNPLPILPFIPSIVRWFTTKDGPMASNGLDDIIALVNSDCYDFKNHKLTNNDGSCEVPDFQYIHVYLNRNLVALAKPIIQRSYGLDDAAFAQISEANVNHAFVLVSPTLLYEESRGSVSLQSSNPSDPPLVKPNYLSDKRDVAKMVKGLKIVEDLVNTPAFKDNDASVLYLEFDDCPKPKKVGPQSDEYWACYARQMTFSALHGAGTAAMERVVDNRLRVHGVKKLRVVDASVFPRPPHGNNGAAVIAVAEKGADLILEDNK